MDRDKVLVLVAAFNGENWLKAQLDSILCQEGVTVSIVISVDKSTDNSLVLCQKYADLYHNVNVLPYGEVFGGAGSNFFRLIKETDFSEFDCIAFSDQDDIWYENKLLRAIDYLDYYSCYSSNVTAFWDDGREVLIDKAQPQTMWDYLFEAAGPGCTYVFKKDFAVKFQSWLIDNYSFIVENIALHDWLLYAFARVNCFGWFIDPRPSMLYRQHQNNQIGTNNNIKAAKKRLHLVKGKWYRVQVINIVSILELYNSPIVRKGIMNDYFGNLYLFINVYKLRRRWRDKLALAIFLIFNLF